MKRFWEWFTEREYRRSPEAKPVPEARVFVPLTDAEIKDEYYDFVETRSLPHFILIPGDAKTWHGVLAQPKRIAMLVAAIALSGAGAAFILAFIIGTKDEAYAALLALVGLYYFFDLKRKEKFFALDSMPVLTTAVEQRYRDLKTRRVAFKLGAEIKTDRLLKEMGGDWEEMDRIILGWGDSEDERVNTIRVKDRITVQEQEIQEIEQDVREYEALHGQVVEDLKVVLLQLRTFDSQAVMERAESVVDDLEGYTGGIDKRVTDHFTKVATQLDDLARKYRDVEAEIAEEARSK